MSDSMVQNGFFLREHELPPSKTWKFDCEKKKKVLLKHPHFRICARFYHPFLFPFFFPSRLCQKVFHISSSLNAILSTPDQIEFSIRPGLPG
jgi:hypothetical protein